MPYSKASSDFPAYLEWYPKSSPWSVRLGKIQLLAAPPTSYSLTSSSLIQTYWLPYWSLSMAKDAPATGPLPLFSHPPGTLSRYSYALHSHSILVSYLITPLLRCLLLLRLLSLIILYPLSLHSFSSKYTPLYIYLFVHLLLLFWMESLGKCVCVVHHWLPSA